MSIALVDIPSASTKALFAAVREGVEPVLLDELKEAMGLTTNEMAELVGLSRCTLSRRRRKEDRLGHDASERVLRVSRVFARAQEIFGSAERARARMVTRVDGLDGQCPLDLLDTEPGARWVERVLQQIDFRLPA